MTEEMGEHDQLPPWKPSWSLGPGGQFYVRESGYAPEGTSGFTFDRAMEVTILCLGRWATHFAARSLVGGYSQRGGPTELPRAADQRQRVLRKMLDELEDALEGRMPDGGRLWLAGVMLSKSGWGLLMEAFDGLSGGALALTPTQYAQLQDEWSRRDLPRDLYVPIDELRPVRVTLPPGFPASWPSWGWATPRAAACPEEAA